MGSGLSQEDYEGFARSWYESTVEKKCFMPDVGIDESLLKYSGINSNSELQSYSNDLVNSVPGFITSLGSSFGALTSIPNAVGIGALVISMILEIVLKSQQTSEDSYSMLRRVFGEEKASSVRDTMFEYLKRHRMFISDNQRLLMEIQRLEQQLSNHLTTLRNSMLDDGQMSTRGFKIWVNGASFHVQMLIHQVRLEIQTGKPASDLTAKAAIDEYLRDLHKLLEKYKTYKTSTSSAYLFGYCSSFQGSCYPKCYVENSEAKCKDRIEPTHDKGTCDHRTMGPYLDYIFSNHGPIISLKIHFSDIKNNIDSLIHQHDTFTLPSQ